MIFDGKKEAERIRQELFVSGKLAGKSLLIVQADGGGRESTYVRLKREMGEGLGVEIKILELENSKQVEDKLKSKEIESFGGVLVQLPIVGADPQETQKILDLIPVAKDVDGLTTFSKFLPAAVRAVDRVLAYAWVKENLRFANAAVVGAAGMVGRRLVKWLEGRAVEVERFDIGSDLSRLKTFDVVISATGTPGLIDGAMVKEGVIAIDLGYPKGDMVFEEVRMKAGLVTPVPGGVGPLTIVSLFENLVQV